MPKLSEIILRKYNTENCSFSRRNMQIDDRIPGSREKIRNMAENMEPDLPWLKFKELQECSAESLASPRKCGFRKLYLAVFASLLYPISMGMSGTYSATATVDMKRPGSWVRPTDDQVTWIGSLLAVGALFGGAAAGYVTEKCGRKGAMIIYSIPFVIGWLCIAYATNIWSIYIGRFLTGCCVGAICAVVPAYIVEISTPDIRGMLGSFFQVCACAGALFAAVFPLYMNWQWQAIASCISVVMGLSMICFMPESPRWLVARGHYQAAVDAFKFLHGPGFDALSECASIYDDLSQQPKGKLTIAEISKRGIYLPILLSIGVIVFQQLCGVNAILFYTVEVFKETSTPLPPYESTIALHAIMVVSTIGSGYVLDRLGRKILLIVSGVGMALSLFTLAGFNYAKSLDSSVVTRYSWVPLTTIITDVILFSFGYGPVPWLIIAEMSPNRVRGLIVGIASAFCWGFVFFVTKSFDSLKLHIYSYGTYCLYGVFCVISCFFTAYCLPETKGKSCEEMQDLFDSKNERKKSLVC